MVYLRAKTLIIFEELQRENNFVFITINAQEKKNLSKTQENKLEKKKKKIPKYSVQCKEVEI